jgi:hypothetical protein
MYVRLFARAGQKRTAAHFAVCPRQEGSDPLSLLFFLLTQMRDGPGYVAGKGQKF